MNMPESDVMPSPPTSGSSADMEKYITDLQVFTARLKEKEAEKERLSKREQHEAGLVLELREMSKDDLIANLIVFKLQEWDLTNKSDGLLKKVKRGPKKQPTRSQKVKRSPSKKVEHSLLKDTVTDLNRCQVRMWGTDKTFFDICGKVGGVMECGHRCCSAHSKKLYPSIEDPEVCLPTLGWTTDPAPTNWDDYTSDHKGTPKGYEGKNIKKVDMESQNDPPADSSSEEEPEMSSHGVPMSEIAHTEPPPSEIFTGQLNVPTPEPALNETLSLPE